MHTSAYGEQRRLLCCSPATYLRVEPGLQTNANQGQTKDQQCDQCTRWRDPPRPGASQKGAACLRMVQHTTPACGCRVAKPEKAEGRFGQDGLAGAQDKLDQRQRERSRQQMAPHNAQIANTQGACDALNERLVREAFERLRQERTTIVIAHRLSTVKDADMLVVMAHGRVVEQGTHSQLLAQAGMYSHLVKTQLTTAAPAVRRDRQGVIEPAAGGAHASV